MPCLEDSQVVQFTLGLLDQGNYMTIPSFSWRSPSSQMAYWFHPVDLGNMFLVAMTVLILCPSLYPCFLTCNPALAKWMFVSRWAASQGWGSTGSFCLYPCSSATMVRIGLGKTTGGLTTWGALSTQLRPS